MFFDMNKPNPVPPVSDVTANFENSSGNTPGSIPIPVSFTLTMTSPLLSVSLLLLLPSSKSINLPLLSILILTSPSLANLIALDRMLEITCIILPLSASTKYLHQLLPSYHQQNAHLLLFYYNDRLD